MNQKDMQIKVSLSVVRRYEAIKEMQKSSNPLTKEELIEFSKRNPEFEFAVKSWIKSITC